MGKMISVTTERNKEGQGSGLFLAIPLATTVFGCCVHNSLEAIQSQRTAESEPDSFNAPGTQI